MTSSHHAARLGTRAARSGYRLVSHDSIGSTNSDAMQRARDGDPGRLWVFTPEQTAGRGRRGRAWATPRGNLAASLLTVTHLPPAEAATLGFVAGLALTDALGPLLPVTTLSPVLDGVTMPDGRGRLALKWPNDVLLDGAKLAGILLEAEPLGSGRLAVVVGIGVNVVAAPDGLPYPATSLAALHARITAEELLARLTDCWVPLAEMWNEGRGLKALLSVWRDRAAGLGQPVAVNMGSTVVRGIFETVDDTGKLIVLGPDGARHVIPAGEVHFGIAATA